MRFHYRGKNLMPSFNAFLFLAKLGMCTGVVNVSAYLYFEYVYVFEASRIF